MKRAISLLLLTATCAFAQMDDVALIGSLSATNAAAGPFSPTNVAGLKVWLTSDAGLTKAGSEPDRVWQWADQSGNTNHVYNSTGSGSTNFTTGPRYFSDGPNGKPRLQFSDGYMAMTVARSWPQPNTIFVVAQHTFNTTVKFLFDGVTDGQRNALLDHVTTDLYAGSQPAFTHQNFSTYKYITCLFNGASSTLRVNGSQIGGTGNVGAQTFTQLILGAAQNLSAPWNGQIVEVLVYNANVSSTDRDAIEAYLQAKYAL